MDKIIIKCFDDLKGYYKTGKEKFVRYEGPDYYEIYDGKILTLKTEKNNQGLKMIVDMINRFDGNLEYVSELEDLKLYITSTLDIDGNEKKILEDIIGKNEKKFIELIGLK